LATGFQIYVFNHFCCRKLHNDDKKCLVCRGGREESQFIAINSHSQSTSGIIVGLVSSKTDTSLNVYTVLHGWPSPDSVYDRIQNREERGDMG